ncbi:hypothetical protein AHF37_05097 [Paragonimus kellicotti]|nr:hypothetical protein AHF37_05097 [Paragonimus kellicotti]
MLFSATTAKHPFDIVDEDGWLKQRLCSLVPLYECRAIYASWFIHFSCQPQLAAAVTFYGSRVITPQPVFHSRGLRGTVCSLDCRLETLHNSNVVPMSPRSAYDVFFHIFIAHLLRFSQD